MPSSTCYVVADHTRAFALLPMHRLPSLGDWSVWADWLMAHDPEPWRDHRIRKRIARGEPNNVSDPRRSMSQAYCPGRAVGVFEWADCSLTLTEHGWLHGPVCDYWARGDARWRIEHWAQSPWAGPDTIYMRPALYRRFREDWHVEANDVEAHIDRIKQARNPRRRADRGEHKRGRRRT